jgi:hypothetical protein
MPMDWVSTAYPQPVLPEPGPARRLAEQPQEPQREPGRTPAVGRIPAARTPVAAAGNPPARAADHQPSCKPKRPANTGARAQLRILSWILLS